MHSSSPAGQAHVGVDDDFLACGYAARDQFGVDRNSAFDQCQRDQAQLVMAGRRADEAHGGAIELHRIAVRRQALGGTVEVQHDQARSRRPAEIAWAGRDALTWTCRRLWQPIVARVQARSRVQWSLARCGSHAVGVRAPARGCVQPEQQRACLTTCLIAKGTRLTHKTDTRVRALSMALSGGRDRASNRCRAPDAAAADRRPRPAARHGGGDSRQVNWASARYARYADRHHRTHRRVPRSPPRLTTAGNGESRPDVDPARCGTLVGFRRA